MLKKITSIIMTFCVILSLNTTVAFSADDTQKSQTEEVTRTSEIVELRESNSKTYKLSDGTNECVVYAEDVNYVNKDGQYKEIDNSVTVDTATVLGTDYQLRNMANSFTARFADASEKYPVYLEYQGKSVSFGLSGSSPVMATSGNKSSSVFLADSINPENSVTYSQVNPDVDLVYTVNNEGIKEFIVLNAATDKTDYVFDYLLENLTVKQEDGAVYFLDQDGTSVFEIGELFAVDANGAYTDAIECSVISNGDTAQVTVSIDEEYLNDPARAFPIVIDPSVMITGSSVTFDSYISSGYPNNNFYLSTYLRTGYYGSYYKVVRSYIKFDIPSYLIGYGAGDSLASAKIRIRKYSGVLPSIKAYRNTGDWSSSSITWNWKPGNTPTGASGTAYDDGNSWYALNVTEIVRYWMNTSQDEPHPNYGVMIKDSIENSSSHSTNFYSSDAASPNKPELHIYYSEDIFLDFGYWSSSVSLWPYSIDDEVWQTAMDQALTTWNNAATPVEFYKDDYSDNHVYVDYYVDNFLGQTEFISVVGDDLTQFTIKLNTRKIQLVATNLSNLITGTFVHELGHTIWLKDNPLTPSASIMQYSVDHNVITWPTYYDITNVNSKY